MITFEDTSLTASEELKSKLKSLIPNNVPTVVVSLVEKCEDGFTSLLRLALRTKESAIKWVDEYEQKSSTRYRVNGTFAENTRKIVFKKRYHCHRNIRSAYTKTRVPNPRFTDCSAKLCVTIKQPKMLQSKDKYLKKYPCEIDIRFVHNHPTVGDPELNPKKKTGFFGNAISTNMLQNERLKSLTMHSDENDIPSSIYGEQILSSDTDLELIIELENVFTFLKDNLLNYRETFEQPLRQFIENMDSIDSCTDLVMALKNFGKSNTNKHPLVLIENDIQLQDDDSDVKENIQKFHI